MNKLILGFVALIIIALGALILFGANGKYFGQESKSHLQ